MLLACVLVAAHTHTHQSSQNITPLSAEQNRRPFVTPCECSSHYSYRLYELLDAKQISGRFHPHITTWKEYSPHVPPYFGYIAAEKVTAPMKRQETIRESRRS